MGFFFLHFFFITWLAFIGGQKQDLFSLKTRFEISFGRSSGFLRPGEEELTSGNTLLPNPERKRKRNAVLGDRRGGLPPFLVNHLGPWWGCRPFRRCPASFPSNAESEGQVVPSPEALQPSVCAPIPSSETDLDLNIAIRKGTRECTKKPISSYTSYSRLSSSY